MRYFIFLLPWLLSSCTGYTFVQPHTILKKNPWGQAPIYVSPIRNDIGGEFLSAITNALVSRNFCISPEELAEYVLEIDVIKEVDRNVGFSYAPNKQEEVVQKHFLVSDEGRLSLIVNVLLRKLSSREVVFAKKVSSDDVTFDFEPDVGIEDVQHFSLGQYGMHGEAQKSARRTLLKTISQQIANQMYYDLI
ncbi:LPS assembly lipoprotein LptE [Chlamydiifrater phoenicopteri]|uniref:LPS assembly lipoprotein LptE n=1 Tax=Chlamydiifrater phoenicopteri TaxID=2681469 RepID=UPI001BCF22B0|nr:LPS assembly lipoprotein LptE [Chlamydiifrater phoenicopteri]